MIAESALRRLESGDPAGERDPNKPEPASHADRGMALLAGGRAQEARTALRIAIASGDGRPETWLNLALAEAGSGAADRALALMLELQKGQPAWDEPRLRQAEILRSTGNHEAAEQAYENTLEVNPTRVEALLSLAVLKLQRQDGLSA